MYNKTKPSSYMVRQGKYKPQPVRRKETPKPDGGGGEKLGIPPVVDRIIQQTNAQQLTPIYEPLFSDNSFPVPFRFKRKIREEIHAMRVKMHYPHMPPQVRMCFLRDFGALLPCGVCVFLQSHPYSTTVWLDISFVAQALWSSIST